ncbi:CAP domain-containing protein [Spirillospora sp. NPDC048911]|uniref:CAP domain-containing protein n=1 Tax=Spirillospora sp. NPDC048911 TaxID=3364527 RepID=UPI00371A0D56
MFTVTLTVAGAVGAIGVGVALDRLVLPELRSESASASGPAADAARPGASAAGTGTSGGAPTEKDTGNGAGTPRTDGGGGAPTPGVNGSTPPLKPLRGTKQAPKSPSSSPSPGTSRPPQGGNPPPSSGGGPEATVVSLTNKERAKAGCGALRTDRRLATAAERHSADMAAHDYFDHTSRNGDSPWKRMEDAGYTSPGAENIAKGYGTAAAVVEGWMKSPGHRANILNCKLRAIGVGMVAGSGGPWWTQDFGWQ